MNWNLTRFARHLFARDAAQQLSERKLTPGKRRRKARRLSVETLEGRRMLASYNLADWDTVAGHFDTPGTNVHKIVTDYSADVTAQIQAALSALSSGDTLVFPTTGNNGSAWSYSSVGYKVESPLNVNGRNNLTFVGNGAIIKRFTAGADDGSDQSRDQWHIEDSTNISFTNFAVYGADTAASYDAERAFQHGFSIKGSSSDITITNCVVHYSYGDDIDVQVDNSLGNITLSGNTLDDSGRHGLSIASGTGVWVTGNTFNNNRDTIDIEPETASASVDNVIISGNTFGTADYAIFDCNGGGRTGLVYFVNNTSTSTNPSQVWDVPASNENDGPFVYLNNTLNGVGSGSHEGIVDWNEQGVLAAGNNVTFNNSGVTGITVNDSSNLVIGDNALPNAATAVAANFDGSNVYTWSNALSGSVSPLTVSTFSGHTDCFSTSMAYTGGGMVYAIWRLDGGSDSLTANGLTTTSDYAVVIVNSSNHIVYGAGFNGTSSYNGTQLDWILPAAPVIAVQPQSQKVVTSTAAHFSVVVNGGAPVTSYQWQKNTGSGFTNVSGATSALYTPTVTTGDSGNTYRCAIVNQVGTTYSATATLTVVSSGAAPTVSTQPASVAVNVGYTATFTVASNSAGPLTYQWQKNGTNIAGAIYSSFTTPDQVIGNNGATYACVITSPYGSVTSNAATLTVTNDDEVTDNFTGTTGNPWNSTIWQWAGATSGITRQITGNQGEISNNTSGGTTYALVTSSAAGGLMRDTTQTVSIDLTTHSLGQFAGLVARYVSTTQNYQVVIGDNSTHDLEIWSDGVELASTNYSWNTGTQYQLKMQVTQTDNSDTEIDAKIWVTGNSEPGSWTLVTTDNDPNMQNVFGQSGIVAKTGTNNGQKWRFDGYDLTGGVGGANQSPVANFVAPVQPEGLTVNFDGSSSLDPNGSIVNYQWDFGDGNTNVSEFPTVNHTYATAGNYTVSLTVNDNSGAVDTLSVTLPVAALPAAPTNLKVNSFTQSSVTLGWHDNSGIETGFTIQRTTDSGGVPNNANWTTAGTAAANATTFTDTGLSSSTTYWYRVAGYNAAGDGAWGTVLNAPWETAVSQETTVGAPTGLTMTSSTATQINLSWTDNSSDESGFSIERSPDPESPGSFAVIGSVAANVHTYSDTTVASGTTYHYRVRATNSRGDSTYSNDLTAASQPAGQAPNAPSILHVTSYTSSSITLGWTDNSSDETGFKIERAPDSGGSPGTWTQIATVGANVTSYNNTGLTTGTLYWYRVRSYNSNGNSGYTSSIETETAGSETDTWTGSNGASWNGNWTFVAQPWATVDINGNHGRLTGGSTGAGYAYYAAGSVQDTDQVMEFEGNSNAMAFGEIARVTAADNDTYYRVVTGSLNATTLLIQKVVNGTATTLQTVTGLNYNSGTWYWLEFALVTSGSSTTLEVKTWQDGNTEPTSWTATQSDSTAVLQRAGYDGLYANGSNGTSRSYLFDNWTESWDVLNISAAPSGLTTSALADDQVQVNWTSNSSDETGFKVDRATNSSFTTGLVTTTVGKVTSFVSTGLSANTTYYYRVRSYNQMGSSSNTGTSTVTTTSAPIAPSGLAGTTVSKTEIDLTWVDNSDDETGFKIDRATNSSFTTGLTTFTIATANTTSYSDTGVSADTQYWYRVRSYDSHGSSANSASINKISDLNDPTNVTATVVSNTQVNVTWTDNSTHENSYIVVRTPDDGGQPDMNTADWAMFSAGGANTTSYNDTTATTDQNYWYGVFAWIYPTEVASAIIWDNVITLPAAPSSLAVVATGAMHVDLSWTNNSSTETGFAIFRAPDVSGSPGTFTQIGSVGSAPPSYSDTSVAPETKYWYEVTAVNGTGSSGYSNQVSQTTAIAAPSSLTATTISTSEIDLGWIDNSSDEDGYSIERAPDAGGVPGTFSQIGTVGANVTTYADTTASAETTYWYRVQAYKGSSYGDYSSNVSAPTMLPAPSSLAVTGYSDTDIALSWTDNSSTETSFAILRAPDAGGSPGTFTQVGTAAANATTYDDAELTGSTIYWYEVQAVSGVSSSVVSSSVSQLTAPAAPSGLAATTSSPTEIDLTWTDNSSDENGFVIDRAPDAGGSPGTWTTGYGTVAANVTSFSDTGASAGTTYWYRVSATNSGGGVSNDGAPVSETSQSTLGDSFTGTDGSSWPGQWSQQVLSGAGATATIQGNQGQVANSGSGETFEYINTNQAENTNQTVQFQMGSTNVLPSLIARADLVNDTYYEASVVAGSTNNVIIQKVVDGVATTIATTSMSLSTGTTYQMRFEVVSDGMGGTNLNFKVWSGTEPGSWTLSTNDTTTQLQGLVGSFGISTGFTGADSALYGNYTANYWTGL